MSVNRNQRQKEVSQWCERAFGARHAKSLAQRGIRLAEEAIEAAQAAGCDKEMVHKLVDHVYAKETGKLSQEIGGVGITLLALAEALGVSAEDEEGREFARVLSKPLKHFAARNEEKNRAGFNVVESDAAETEAANDYKRAEWAYEAYYKAIGITFHPAFADLQQFRRDAWVAAIVAAGSGR